MKAPERSANSSSPSAQLDKQTQTLAQTAITAQVGDLTAKLSATADNVLILRSTRYEGRESIMRAYHRRAVSAAATAAAPGAAPAAPARERTAFNVMIGNPLIIVHGATATSEVIFTEYRQDKKGDPMKMTTQGKEYATWVKVKDHGLYKTRQIANDSEPPADWKE